MMTRTETLADLMTTTPVVLDRGAHLDQALWILRSCAFRHLPVVDGDRLVGILSDRDLLRAFGLSTVEQVAIADIMTVDVQTITADTPAHEAVEMLLDLKIGCLPVLGEEGQLVGLVTQTDFLEVAHRALVQAAQTLAR